MKPALNNLMVRLFKGCRRSACQRVVGVTDDGVDLLFLSALIHFLFYLLSLTI